jgi:hypothetical protein
MNAAGSEAGTPLLLAGGGGGPPTDTEGVKKIELQVPLTLTPTALTALNVHSYSTLSSVAASFDFPPCPFPFPPLIVQI